MAKDMFELNVTLPGVDLRLSMKSFSPVLMWSLLLIAPIIFLWKQLLSRVDRGKWYKYYNELLIIIPLVVPKDTKVRSEFLRKLTIVGICIALVRAVYVLQPIFLRHILDSLSSSTDTIPWKAVVAFVLMRTVVPDGILRIMSHYQHQIDSGMSHRTMKVVYAKYLDLSADFHDSNKSGSSWNAISRSGRQIFYFVGDLLFRKLPIVIDVVLGIGACWQVFDGTIALAMVVTISLYLSVPTFFASLESPSFKVLTQRYTSFVDLGHDTITNWQTVSYFNRREHEIQRFAKSMDELQNVENESLLSKHEDTLRKLASALGLMTVSLIAAYQIQHSGRSMGNFVMIIQFWTSLVTPMEDAISFTKFTESFLAEIEQIIEILRTEPTIKDKDNAQEFQPQNGTIDFQHVSFGYKKEREVIHDVSLRFEGGTTVAVVGETGGGKSTLLKLLCRAYDVTSGSIKIDGQDVRDLRLGSLRDHIAIVPQNIGVFNISIYENLRYANLDASREQIEDACTAAALHKKIETFPMGYDEVVGEKGQKLSGGELQRLAIARALLRDAEIILFDEATSNLDAETESRIQEYLKKWYVGKTVIIVAHRLATIANADLIIAFRDGIVVESGTHKDLLAKKGYFYDLWTKQTLFAGIPEESS